MMGCACSWFIYYIRRHSGNYTSRLVRLRWVGFVALVLHNEELCDL
jgi:hypothetical protein